MPLSVRHDLVQFAYVNIGVTLNILYSQFFYGPGEAVTVVVAVYDTALNLVTLSLCTLLISTVLVWAGYMPFLVDFKADNTCSLAGYAYGVLIFTVAFAISGLCSGGFFGLCLGLLVFTCVDLRASVVYEPTMSALTGTPRGKVALSGVVAVAASACSLALLMASALPESQVWGPRSVGTSALVDWILPFALPLALLLVMRQQDLLVKEVLPEVFFFGMPFACLLSLAWVVSASLTWGYGQAGHGNVTDALFGRAAVAPSHFVLGFTTHLALLCFVGMLVGCRTAELLCALVSGFTLRRMVYSADGGGAAAIGCTLLNCVAVCAVVSRVLHRSEYSEGSADDQGQQLPSDLCQPEEDTARV